MHLSTSPRHHRHGVRARCHGSLRIMQRLLISSADLYCYYYYICAAPVLWWMHGMMSREEMASLLSLVLGGFKDMPRGSHSACFFEGLVTDRIVYLTWSSHPWNALLNPDPRSLVLLRWSETIKYKSFLLSLRGFYTCGTTVQEGENTLCYCWRVWKVNVKRQWRRDEGKQLNSHK